VEWLYDISYKSQSQGCLFLISLVLNRNHALEYNDYLLRIPTMNVGMLTKSSVSVMKLFSYWEHKFIRVKLPMMNIGILIVNISDPT